MHWRHTEPLSCLGHVFPGGTKSVTRGSWQKAVAGGIMQMRLCQNTTMDPHSIQWSQRCPHPAKHRKIFLGCVGHLLSQKHHSKPDTCTIYWCHEHRWDSYTRRYIHIRVYRYAHTYMYLSIYPDGRYRRTGG